MREYLSRGKRIDNGEWVEGYYVSVGGEYHFIFTGKICFGQGYANYEKFRVDPETVGQDTGMTDKNGVKIFEGDIVVSTNANRLSNKPYIVEFSAISGYWCCDPKREPVVIGNIHDNPEILEEGGEE